MASREGNTNALTGAGAVLEFTADSRPVAVAPEKTRNQRCLDLQITNLYREPSIIE